MVGCKGSKDILIAIDASKSVTSKGWKAEIDFAVTLVEEITSFGNPNDHRLNVHWFNADTMPIGASGGKNSPGTFSSDGPSLVNSIGAVSYDMIRSGSTDHPQVYETAEAAFNSASSRGNAPKVLVMITDGETHGGNRCKKLIKDTAALENKIGRCTGNQNHACYPRDCTGSKCLCGLYTAELFKDKGFKLVIAGISNQNHAKDTELGVFKKIMETSASPGEAYVAEDFEGLADLVDPLVRKMCT